MVTDEVDTRLIRVLRQQRALAEFSGYALCEDDLLKILHAATRICAQVFEGRPFCSIYEYCNFDRSLRIMAGVGLEFDAIGRRDWLDCPARTAHTSVQPFVAHDLSQTSITPSCFYSDQIRTVL